MKETFESNLSSSQKDEMESLKAYEDLKAAKTDEIAAAKAQLEEKTLLLADTDEKNAQSKEDLIDTKNTLSADEAFLTDLKSQCSMMDSEWEERQKTRQLEMEACSKALALLNSDEAHDLFSKTFSLMQTRSAAHSARRTEASKILSDLSKKTHNPRLAALAYQVRL